MANIVTRDVRSNTGSNVRFLLAESGLDQVEENKTIKEALKTNVCWPKEADAWRLKYLETLLGQRGEALYQGLENQMNHLTDLINSLCIN